MLEIQLRLSFTVATLLIEISAHSITAEVPHHRGRAKPDLIPLVLQSPAQVDIVSSRAEHRVESANLFQSRLPERHIATGNMFSNFVVEQNVRWSSRRHRYGRRDECIFRRREIRPSNRGTTRTHVGCD